MPRPLFALGFVAATPRRHLVFCRGPLFDQRVIFVLLGEACIFASRPLAEWAGLFVPINVLYIPILEEPMLAARFGERYQRYKQAVRRFLPRLHPWTPD